MADNTKAMQVGAEKEKMSVDAQELFNDVIYHLELYSEVMENNRGGLSEKCVTHIGNALGNLFEKLRTL